MHKLRDTKESVPGLMYGLKPQNRGFESFHNKEYTDIQGI